MDTDISFVHSHTFMHCFVQSMTPPKSDTSKLTLVKTHWRIYSAPLRFVSDLQSPVHCADKQTILGQLGRWWHLVRLQQKSGTLDAQVDGGGSRTTVWDLQQLDDAGQRPPNSWPLPVEECDFSHARQTAGGSWWWSGWWWRNWRWCSWTAPHFAIIIAMKRLMTVKRFVEKRLMKRLANRWSNVWPCIKQCAYVKAMD